MEVKQQTTKGVLSDSLGAQDFLFKSDVHEWWLYTSSASQTFADVD